MSGNDRTCLDTQNSNIIFVVVYVTGNLAARDAALGMYGNDRTLAETHTNRVMFLLWWQ